MNTLTDFLEDYLMIGIAAVGVLVSVGILYIFVLAAYEIRTVAQCLALGYPKASVTYNMTRYCIKRVDQTDTVTPLSELRK